jgi:hypothetical protein
MTTTADFNPTVCAWEDAGAPHPYATFRCGYEAGLRARGGEAHERCAQIAEGYPFSPRIGQAIAELIRIAGEQKS